MPDDGIIAIDDGNHTFLTAELMPIHAPKSVILPTDFNCMGYAVPAAIGAKLACPDRSVQAIVGDGAFMMTCMEILTATSNNLGVVYYVFNDGELAQIAQAQTNSLQPQAGHHDREVEHRGRSARHRRGLSADE